MATAPSTSTSTTRSPPPPPGSGHRGATKVALVVPYGSRIATSRMNFRLLSREALVSNRRLSIVAADAATRALAASAGLPVFATVGESRTRQPPSPVQTPEPLPRAPAQAR